VVREVGRIVNQSTGPWVNKAALETALQAVWERAHGAPVSKVHVLVGQESVAALIEGVLTPAERDAAQCAGSQPLLQRYAERLLSVVQPELRAQVEATTGRRIVSASVHADAATGNVLCFFLSQEDPPR